VLQQERLFKLNRFRKCFSGRIFGSAESISGTGTNPDSGFETLFKFRARSAEIAFKTVPVPLNKNYWVTDPIFFYH